MRGIQCAESAMGWGLTDSTSEPALNSVFACWAGPWWYEAGVVSGVTWPGGLEPPISSPTLSNRLTHRLPKFVEFFVSR